MDLFKNIIAAMTDAPDVLAVEDQGVWYSRGQIATIAARLDMVLTKAGLGEGTAVGLVARNRMPHIAALYGLLATRRTTVMIYSARSPEALAKEIQKLRLPAIIADAEDWTPATIQAARGAGSMALMPSAAPVKPVTVVTGINHEQAYDQRAPTPEIAVEMLSSGTTGAPKRIPIRWDTLAAAVQDAELNFRQSGYTIGRAGGELPLIQPAPLANISGLYAVVPAGVYGWPLSLLEKFTIPSWLAAVARNQPQTSWLAPASIRALWEADVAPEALSSLVSLRTGSAALSSELQREFEKKYNLAILVVYGATEFCGVIVMWTLEDHARFGPDKRGSAGRARPGIGMRVRDVDSGVLLPAGETGILELQIGRLGEDWIETTDLAAVDEDGFLFLHGRADDAINRGGFKIMPLPVIEALRRHPAVADAAVVGIADPRLGEVPVAAIELNAGAEIAEPELRNFLRDHLLAYQIPARILTVGQLPRTPSLKIDRTAVQDLFSADQAAPMESSK